MRLWHLEFLAVQHGARLWKLLVRRLVQELGAPAVAEHVGAGVHDLQAYARGRRRVPVDLHEPLTDAWLRVDRWVWEDVA
mgnify:CR=1 FL=1